MKKNMQKVIVTMLTLGFIVSTSAMAQVVSKTIKLPEATWVNNVETKTNDLDYGQARCAAVYPTDSSVKDTYTKIKARAVDSNGAVISRQSYYVLEEGETATTIYYKAMFLNYAGETVNMQFRGNSDTKPAKADVVYTVN